VFGSEGQGLSGQLRETAKLVRIDMSNRIESLNVAAAAAILLWRVFNER
jgi:tRNA G18 (ribose-2'-O)-methylase SpoU